MVEINTQSESSLHRIEIFNLSFSTCRERKACPVCQSARIRRRSRTKDYVCSACDHIFKQPIKITKQIKGGALPKAIFAEA